jgi:hypothetical protein
MASDDQDGGRKSKEYNCRICQQFSVVAMSFKFDQQHDQNSYFVKSKMVDDPNKILSLNLGVFNIFPISLLH